jgi:hypothetical protein
LRKRNRNVSPRTTAPAGNYSVHPLATAGAVGLRN